MQLSVTGRYQEMLDDSETWHRCGCSRVFLSVIILSNRLRRFPALLPTGSPLKLYYSSRISITWELVRDAETPAPPPSRRSTSLKGSFHSFSNLPGRISSDTHFHRISLSLAGCRLSLLSLISILKNIFNAFSCSPFFTPTNTGHFASSDPKV